MRLFIAITLDDPVRDALSDAIRKLKEKASGGNFTRRENLHLTLAFLGEVKPERVADIKAAMNRVSAEPFQLSFSGFGTFKRHGGNIHWAGVLKSEELISIQRKLSAELEKAGFPLENRAFSPHLTLGREVRLPDSVEDIYGSLAKMRHQMDVSKISLMKSERIEGNLIYTEIYGKELG